MSIIRLVFLIPVRKYKFASMTGWNDKQIMKTSVSGLENICVKVIFAFIISISCFIFPRLAKVLTVSHCVKVWNPTRALSKDSFGDSHKLRFWSMFYTTSPMSIIRLEFLTPVRKYKFASTIGWNDMQLMKTSVSGLEIKILWKCWLARWVCNMILVSASSWLLSDSGIAMTMSSFTLKTFSPSVTKMLLLPIVNL